MNSLTSSNGNIDKKVTEIAKQFETIEHSVELTEQKYSTLNANYKLLHERVIHLECQSRRDNLLIDGLPESPPDVKETNQVCLQLVQKTFAEKLSLPNAYDIKIVRCHRLGPPPRARPSAPLSTRPNSGSQARPGTVIVKFHWFGDRQAVWQARTKLKNTGIFITEDFPKEIVDRRKILTPIMYAAKDKHLDAFLIVDKLHIQTKDQHNVYDVNSLSRLPPALDPRYVTTKKTEHVLSFFGSLCPMSNFHPSPFTCEGRSFRWVEEYFFHKKAELGDDQNSIRKLAEATSPSQCKGIGRNIKCNQERWHQEDVAIMRKALYEKFTQNPELKRFLMNTGTLHLAEASPTDKFWGTGIGLGKEGVTNQNSWPGKNKLGELLM
jgi:ribA/ribD-fused uncharacterized protein